MQLRNRLPRILAGVLSAALGLMLTGCAVQPSRTTAMSDYTIAMNHAQSSMLMDQRDAAISGYKAATRADPTAAKPWIELSQLYFEDDDYGHAIVAAREGLKRQPGNWRVDSIMTISGLRVTFQALKRLHSKVSANTDNALDANNTVREDARRLVTLLRSILGVDVLIASHVRQEPASTSHSPVATLSRVKRDPEPVITPSPPETTSLDAAAPAPPHVPGDPFTVLKALSGN